MIYTCITHKIHMIGAAGEIEWVTVEVTYGSITGPIGVDRPKMGE